jgi:acetoin utilization protein AcuB
MALKTVVEIQVESRQVAAIEKILSDAGYTVTSAVLTNQK